MKILWRLIMFVVWLSLTICFIAGIFHPHRWFIGVLFIFATLDELAGFLKAITDES